MATSKRQREGPVTAVVVGAGHRGILYASYALQHPDELKIVGVVDPNERRSGQVAGQHGFGMDRWFRSCEELVRRGRIADAAINATMDRLHVPTSLPLLRAGYDLLLEKPVATRAADVRKLLKVARQKRRTVMVCHVLRYAPFYAAIRRQVASGRIGRILSIRTTEHVSYHHMATAFIRGKWANQKRCESSMLMSKCSHDMDVLVWMKSGVAPRWVSSFGSLMYFRPENAPKGAGRRCLKDCRIEKTCPYSAKTMYVDRAFWKFYAWETVEHLGSLTRAEKLASLREDNPYGRCVWHCDNDVVDHQVVSVEFEDGSTASHNMIGGTAKPFRQIHIIGTHGEIEGEMEAGVFYVRHADLHGSHGDHEYTQETVDVNVGADGHGGGDLRLVEDFVRVLRGEKPSLSTTHLEDSIYGALVGFAADKARVTHRAVRV
jgi:predicted dehydrogenase